METTELKSGSRSEELESSKVRLMVWSGLYVLSMAVATFGPTYIWEGNVPLTLAGILLNLLIGLGMILSNRKHLLRMDELMQKIQLEAMGVALGIGVVAGLSYSLLDITNLIHVDAEIAFLVMLMGVVYLITLFVNYKRYG